MDPTQFDDFIKSNTQNGELPVPPELSWENMSFPIPPTKRKRRILPWFLFLFFGAAGIVTLWWHTYTPEHSQTEPLSFADSTKAQNPRSPETAEKTNTAKRPESFPMEPNKIPEVHSASHPNAEEADSFDHKDVIQKDGSLSADRAAESRIAEPQTVEPQQADALLRNSSELFIPFEGISKPDSGSLIPCPSIEVLSIGSVQTTSSENLLAMPMHEHEPTESDTKPSARPRYVLVSAGANKARMHHSIAEMNNAETAAWGNSYQLLFDQELKNNWLLSVGLGYHRLHSTFYFEKDLGTFTNVAQGQVIRQTRRVFHNNYFHMASLMVGGGKEFIFSPKWKGQVLVYVSPSYRVKYTGRMLIDSENIIDLTPDTRAKNRWLFNSEAALRLSYKLNKTNLILGVHLTQSLIKSAVLSEPDYQARVRPQIFGLHLGIKRAL